LIVWAADLNLIVAHPRMIITGPLLGPAGAARSADRFVAHYEKTGRFRDGLQ